MKILLTGGNGLVGRSIRRVVANLSSGWKLDAPSRREVDFTNQNSVAQWFETHQYDAVVHAAARVGGIYANITYPTAFLSANTLMNTIVIEAARTVGIQNLLFIGSSCMYPKDLNKSLQEEDVLSAPLEPTNEGYALAKILGARHCAAISREFGLNYRTIVPCNLYGPDDHFDLEKGHLVASALRKVTTARDRAYPTVEIWGDGTARREFMFVDDLAHFIIEWLPRLEQLPQAVNVGVGKDYSVSEYYRVAADVVGYVGKFVHDPSRPTGMRQKLLDVSLSQRLGWKATTELSDGMQKAYKGMLCQDADNQERM